MGTIAIVWGVLAIVGAFIAFLPCLGALNWLNVPFSLIGAVISGVAVSGSDPDRSKAWAGLVMCMAAVIIGIFRLMLGGGIF